ncbi:MAG: RICIN domain-containing protein [Candidatus Kapabacteria bacterium]|nr:RICIN domain-containing protein [Candidatus Kapabacteria bacterium]
MKLSIVIVVAVLCAIGFEPVVAQPAIQQRNLNLDGVKVTKKIQPQRETNSFAQFNQNATGLNKTNAYLLSYLSLMIYAQNLDSEVGETERALQESGTLFELKYKERTAHMFSSPVFKFIPKTNQHLLNPEAMCIATSKEIIIVFRGTDRLVNTDPGPLGDLIYDWGEWIVTDANVLPLVSPNEGIAGKLHKGMKQSVDLIDDAVIRFVTDNGGATKPVWLTGHSLGGAEAQIMAGTLKKKGMNVKGVYLYNSPHPGDPTYASALNTLVGRDNIQRFEYLDDPIAMLPPQTTATRLLTGFPLPLGSPVGGFGRAGVRNFYSKQNGANFFAAQPERQEGQSDRNNLGRSGAFSPLAICYHNPHWICNAAFLELPEETRAKLPLPPSLDDCEACTPDAKETGITGIPFEQKIAKDVADAVGDVVETVSFNVGNIFANFVGNAIPEGDYYIRCNKGKKYLDISGGCMNSNGCKAQLWDLGSSKSNNIFTIRKEGPSYRVKLRSNGKSLEVKGEERMSNGGDIQIWDGNPIGIANANQKWFFYKIPNSKNAYLMVNAASFKVLDAVNSGINSNGGGVQIYDSRSNDQTQVWILEKTS